MKRLLLPALFSLAFVVGCKGQKGDRGADGNANVISYSGYVTGDDQLIFVNGNPSTYAVSVSILVGESYLNLPIYNVTGGFNVLYSFKAGVVELMNAQKGNGTQYKIFLINRTGGSSVSGYRHLIE